MITLLIFGVFSTLLFYIIITSVAIIGNLMAFGEMLNVLIKKSGDGISVFTFVFNLFSAGVGIYMLFNPLSLPWTILMLVGMLAVKMMAYTILFNNKKN